MTVKENYIDLDQNLNTHDEYYTTVGVHLWHMDIKMDLRDRCDGNIKMKLNDEHAYAHILRVCLGVAL